MSKKIIFIITLFLILFALGCVGDETPRTEMCNTGGALGSFIGSKVKGA